MISDPHSMDVKHALRMIKLSSLSNNMYPLKELEILVDVTLDKIDSLSLRNVTILA